MELIINNPFSTYLLIASIYALYVSFRVTPAELRAEAARLSESANKLEELSAQAGSTGTAIAIFCVGLLFPITLIQNTYKFLRKIIFGTVR